MLKLFPGEANSLEVYDIHSPLRTGESIIMTSCTWTFLLSPSMTKHDPAESQHPWYYLCSHLRLGFHHILVLWRCSCPQYFFFITSTFGRSFHSSLCFIAEFFQFFCFSRDSSISCGRDVSFNTLNCCRMFCCSCNFSWVLVTLNAYELSVLWLHIKKPTLLPALL